MASVVFKGKVYPLRFDMYAMEQIEDEYGSMKKVFQELQDGSQLKATRFLFKVLANSYRSFAGEPENVTGNEIRHAGIHEIREVSAAIRAAIEEGTRSETTGGGEADDEVHDAYLEEIERKN